MAITNVAWIQDQRNRPVLMLELDGHPAYIHSGQETALLDRGILRGMVFLASERGAQSPSPFVQGDFGSELGPTDLIGCTDDAAVFGLYRRCARRFVSIPGGRAPPTPYRTFVRSKFHRWKEGEVQCSVSSVSPP